MGKITGASQNIFKSAEPLYSKIKREWKSFGAVNLLDDADFPQWTSEVLRELGNSVLKEQEALLFVKDGKAKIPKGFMQLEAAFKCRCDSITTPEQAHEQNKIFFNLTDTEILMPCENKCSIGCDIDPCGVVQTITIRQFVQEGTLTYKYVNPQLLRLSPNVKAVCSDSCLNLMSTCYDEITMDNGYFFTNFKDEDIYIKYYGLPTDENGYPMIPADNIHVERTIEWYIKWQLLLSYWLVDDLANAQTKWQKAEQLYLQNFAEAKFHGKLPAFSTLVNEARMRRGLNPVTFFSQIDRHY